MCFKTVAIREYIKTLQLQRKKERKVKHDTTIAISFLGGKMSTVKEFKDRKCHRKSYNHHCNRSHKPNPKELLQPHHSQASLKTTGIGGDLSLSNVQPNMLILQITKICHEI